VRDSSDEFEYDLDVVLDRLERTGTRLDSAAESSTDRVDQRVDASVGALC
jgi:hypothetical protein